MTRWQYVLSVGGIVLCLVTAQRLVAHAHDRPMPQLPALPQAAVQETVQGRLTIPEVALVNQRGDHVHLYRDLIQGKVVAINFVYTTCRTVCSLMGAKFAELQQRLHEQEGEETLPAPHLLSISVDPVVDTPQRLQAWGQQFQAGPGWTMLTGDKYVIETLLKALQVFTPDKGEHAPIVLVGNDAAGTWMRVNGLAATPSMLAQLLTALSHAAAPAVHP
jgi:protein SCO1